MSNGDDLSATSETTALCGLVVSEVESGRCRSRISAFLSVSERMRNRERRLVLTSSSMKKLGRKEKLDGWTIKRWQAEFSDRVKLTRSGVAQ